MIPERNAGLVRLITENADACRRRRNRDRLLAGGALAAAIGIGLVLR